MAARILPGAPSLATSPDAKWLAVGGEGLRLFNTGTEREQRRAELAGEIDVCFTPSQKLITCSRKDDHTVLTAWSCPELAPSSAIELDGRCRLWGAFGERILVATEAGTHPALVLLTTRLQPPETIALAEPLKLVFRAPEDRLLALNRTPTGTLQLECWNPAARRIMLHLNLPLGNDPRLGGFSYRNRYLWIASEKQIDVFRYSDGRPQVQVGLSGSLVAAQGHPESSRLVIATQGKSGIDLELLDLVLRDRSPLAFEGVQAFTIVEGETAKLAFANAEGEIRFHTLTGTTISPARPSGETVTTRTAVKSERPPTAAGWRGRLAAWSARTLAGELDPLPKLDETRLGGELAGLAPAAQAALAISYGEWLRGRDGGVALAELAAALMRQGDENAAWEALLHDGALHRFCRIGGGRLHLRRAAARWFDDRPANIEIVPPGDDVRPDRRAGAWVVRDKGRDPVELAQAVARALGAEVGLVALENGKPMGLAEARIRRVIPLVVGPFPRSALRPRWIERATEPIVIASDDPRPAALTGLPELTLG